MNAFSWFEFCFFSAQLKKLQSLTFVVCAYHILLSIAYVAIFLVFFFFYDYRDSSNNTSLSFVIMTKSQLQNFADSTTEKEGLPVT